MKRLSHMPHMVCSSTFSRSLDFLKKLHHTTPTMNTAQIILSQIKAIDHMALFAWGAKNLVNMGDGLKFKTSGMTPWKGYVYVK